MAKTELFLVVVTLVMVTTASPHFKLESVADIPDTSPLKQELQALSTDAQTRALSKLRTFSVKHQDLHGDNRFRVDSEGSVFVADHFQPDVQHKKFKVKKVSPEQAFQSKKHIHRQKNNYKVQNHGIPHLSSKPGSSNVYYLDFVGGTVSSQSAWTSVDLTYLPCDWDDDPSSFSAAEQAHITDTWARIAEDFIPWDVDITTVRPSAFGPTVASCVFTFNSGMPSQSAGGVAYVGVFGNSNFFPRNQPAWVYFNNLGKNSASMAEAGSHEIGHNLGLSHDGKGSSEYYGGVSGSLPTNWAPIMGTGYGRQISQWSKGDYSGATQTQDDVAIITNDFGLRDDDISDSADGAKQINIDRGSLQLDGSVNTGIIERSTDKDMWQVVLNQGLFTVTVEPFKAPTFPSKTRGNNLDVRLRVLDSSLNQVVSQDSQSDTKETYTNANMPAGKYFIEVSSGTGTENGDSYPVYGSLGQYSISGEVGSFSTANAITIPDEKTQAAAVTGTVLFIIVAIAAAVGFYMFVYAKKKAVQVEGMSNNKPRATTYKPNTVTANAPRRAAGVSPVMELNPAAAGLPVAQSRPLPAVQSRPLPVTPQDTAGESPPAYAAPEAPTSTALAGDWEEFFDQEHQLPYWYNAATGESVWEKPY